MNATATSQEKTITTDGNSAQELQDADAHGLAPIPDSLRTSTASAQFWIWCGANVAPINWVLGALGIELGLSLTDTIAALVVGNLIGMSLFGAFVLMGQRTAVTQMVLSRGAFGRRGAYLPALIQGLMSAGWCAINTWIVLDLVMALLGMLGFHGGTITRMVIVVLVMSIQTVIAVRGFAWIAKFEKYTVPVTLVILLAMTVVAWTQLGVHWNFAGEALSGVSRWSAMSTVMTAIGIGWGITWFAYASDYSRFTPRSMPARKLFLASALGQFIPVIWLGVFGATLATITQTADPGELVVGAFGILAVPVLLLVLHGPVATNILNIYSCTLAAQTLDWRVSRRLIAIVVGVLAAGFTLYLVFDTQLASSLDTWLGGLVTWVAPWGGIMLVHHYIVEKGAVDVPALFDPPGRSRLGDIRWPGLIAFFAGIAATWCFEFGVPRFLQGPIASALGGIDLSWLAGLLVAGVSYYILATITNQKAKATK